MRIVISVPHGGCEDTGFRNCDEIASKVAWHLYSLFKGEFQCNVHVNAVPRKIQDMNRKSARETDYRLGLLNLLRGDVFLIDCHSYEHTFTDPPDSTKVLPVGMYIVDYPPVPSYVKHIAASTGIRLLTDNNPRRSDIIFCARDAGVCAMLLEICEIKEDYPRSQIEKFAAEAAAMIRSGELRSS